MGVVYRSHDLALDRNVALKILSPELAEDERFRERFLTESRLAASIDHQNIIPIYDAGEVAGELHIAMRYVDGSDLKKVLAEGPLPAERAIAVISQVAAALDAAHERGLVHRDIKPSNVLLDERGHVYLADFGLSRRLGAPGAALGAAQSLGTIDYVAPEQIRGEDVDGRADLYSLGCLLHECVTGKPPFARPSDSAVLFAHLEEEPPAAPGLEDVMRTALAKEPDERFQTGQELVEAARKALGIAEPRRSRWPLAAAGVGAALIGAALLAFFLTRGDGAVQPTATGRLVRIDAATGEVKQTIRVGDRPAAVAVGSGAVWIASPSANTVWRVDRPTGVVRAITGIQEPRALAVAGGVVYVVTPSAIGRIDAENSTVSTPVAEQLRCGTTAIGAGQAGLWIAHAGNCATTVTGRLGSRDVSSNHAERLSLGDDAGGVVIDRIPIPRRRNEEHDSEHYSDLAVGTGTAWVIGDSFDQATWQLDARTHTSARIALPGAPLRVALGAGGVWVTSLLDDRVWRVDPVTRRVVAVIPVGRGSSGVAVAGGNVWVANAIDGTVSRIDPRTNRVRDTIDVGGYLPALAAEGTDVWVTADDS